VDKILEMLDEMIEGDQEGLTDWEKKFIKSVNRQRKKGLTARQNMHISQIWDKWRKIQ